MSPNMAPAEPSFLVEVAAKRDFGLALREVDVSILRKAQELYRRNSLHDVLAAICAELGSAWAHNVVGWGDVSSLSTITMTRISFFEGTEMQSNEMYVRTLHQQASLEAFVCDAPCSSLQASR